MAKHRDLDYGDRLPASLLDALQEFVSTLAPNLRLQTVAGVANAVEVPAGLNSDQVGIGIDGLWRYNVATVNTVVSGAAGTYNVYATCGANAFATNPSPPPPELDNTDYGFDLQALVQPNTPSLTGGVTNFRKIGELVWDGSRILSLQQTINVETTAQGFQPGDLKTSAVASPQPGWLPCDGAAVSRTTYAALYAALGGATSPWGQGDNSTTFNVPDLRGRALLGAGQGAGLSARALAASGGAETHTLTWDQSGVNGYGQTAGHTHGVNVWSGYTDTNHYHTGATGWMDRSNVHGHTARTAQGGGVWAYQASHNAAGGTSFGMALVNAPVTVDAVDLNHLHGFQTTWQSETYNNANHRHAVNGSSDSAAAGLVSRNADTAHNNMQPWAAVNIFIKI